MQKGAARLTFQEFKFEGGRIVSRDAGQMFDQKTGKQTTWEKGIKILGETKPITLTVPQVLNIEKLLKDDEFIAWINQR